MAKEKLKSTDFIGLVLQQSRRLVTRNEEIYEYVNGKYIHLDLAVFKKDVCSYITDCVPDAATPRMVNEVVEGVKMRTTEEYREQPCWIGHGPAMGGNEVLVLQNGILDLSPLYRGKPIRLLPHTSDLFSVAKAEYPYDPAATCPKFDAWFDWFTCGDKSIQLLLLQWMAYVLLLCKNFQKFLVLRGDGKNGKSVFFNILRMLVGDGNHTAIPIDRLGSRFASGYMYGSRVNIDGDANMIHITALGLLKQLVEKAPLPAEQKFKESKTVVFHTRIACACNGLPYFKDTSDGIWRRLILVDCDARVEDSAIECDIEDEFNMSGILNRVLAVAADLVHAKDFTLPASVKSAVKAEKLSMNPVALFVEEKIVRDPSAVIKKQAVYDMFKDWAEEGGFANVTKVTFGKRLKQYVGGVTDTKVDRQHAYRGIQFEYIARAVANSPKSPVPVILSNKKRKTPKPEPAEPVSVKPKSQSVANAVPVPSPPDREDYLAGIAAILGVPYEKDEVVVTAEEIQELMVQIDTEDD